LDEGKQVDKETKQKYNNKTKTPHKNKHIKAHIFFLNFLL
jgi:hypothetical protein